MVFDATISGIKNPLWDTRFLLRSMGSLIMIVGPNAHMVELDVGEIFDNFRLYLVLANYYRMDLVSCLGHRKDQKGTPVCMHWVRLIMGLYLSPYTSNKVMLW